MSGLLDLNKPAWLILKARVDHVEAGAIFLCDNDFKVKQHVLCCDL